MKHRIQILLITFSFVTTLYAQQREDKNLGQFFKGAKGTFVMYDVERRTTTYFNKKQSKKRISPCSTFKILNSLIGLEAGVIPDENFVIKWDSTKYNRPEWNQDHTLRSAIQNSVVWYYRELARRVGDERMKNFMSKVRYGNGDISGGLDKFWLESSLAISANEQMEFLLQLYNNQLPFSQRSIDIVKNILILPSDSSLVFRGKTGSGVIGEHHTLGWFVGYVERDKNAYIFAVNIESDSVPVDGKRAREIAENILKSKSIL